MTQNEVDIIKNAVLDATEAYVDARLSVLDFVKTQIGVVVSNTKRTSDGKYIHKVRCNATRNTSGTVYNNVLSVGNTPFPAGCVVFMVAPNAQFSNQFILGQLDNTPVNITAGSIRLGGTNEGNAPIYLTGTTQSDGSYGHIADFKIFPNKLQFTGNNSAISFIQGTGFRISEFLYSGGSGYRVSLMMDGNNARFAVNTEGYPNGGLIVSNAQGWDGNGDFFDPTRGNYIRIEPTSIDYNLGSGTGYNGTIGAGAFKFLGLNQDNLENLRVFMDSSRLMFSSPYGTVTLNW